MRNLLLLLPVLAAGCSAPIQRPPAAPDADSGESPAAAGATAGGESAAEIPSVAKLPKAVTSFGAARVGTALYVLGGYSGTPHKYSRAGQSGSFQRVDLGKAESWEDLAGVEPLQSVTLSAHGGALYRTGGMRALNEDGQPADMHSIKEVARFDPKSGAWTELPPLPDGRSSHAAAFVGSKLYVVGGWKLEGTTDNPTWHDTSYVLDTAAEAPAWQALATPFKRRALALGSSDGRLVAIGGMNSEGKPVTDVFILDPESGKWTEGPAFPGEGFGAAASPRGEHIYASGSDGALFALHLKPEPGWTKVGALAQSRFFHQLIDAPFQGVFAVGGIARMAAHARVREIEAVVAQSEPGEGLVSWVLPSPMDTKNRQGMFIEGDKLYLFGGNRSLGQHDFEPQHFSDSGYVLDLKTMRIESSSSSFPMARQSMVAAAATGDRASMLLGGFGHDGTAAKTHPEIHVFDGDKQAWSLRTAGLPRGRTQFGIAEHDGALWIFGGLNYDPTRPRDAQFQHELSILVVGPEATTEAEAKLPRQRRAFAGAKVGNRYYMFGGMQDGFQLVEPCEAYDFDTRKFDTVTCPAARLSGEAVAIGGRIYLVGGSVRGEDGKLAATSKVEVYDPQTDSWSVLHDELPIAGKHLRAFEHQGDLLLVSAHREAAEVAVLRVDVPAANAEVK